MLKMHLQVDNGRVLKQW